MLKGDTRPVAHMSSTRDIVRETGDSAYMIVKVAARLFGMRQLKNKEAIFPRFSGILLLKAYN